MLVHFEVRGELHWEALGSGVSGAADPLPVALADLRSLHDDPLPAGLYRSLRLHGREPRLETFLLGEDGELLD